MATLLKRAGESPEGETLRTLASRLQSVREEERAALSRELHDGLGQQLTAFALQFELLCMDGQMLAAEPSGFAALYDRVVALLPQVERLTEQTQKLCSSLRPVVLDELGLVAAIECLVEDAAKRSGMVCTLSLPESEAELDRDSALALFRIAQESLAHAHRHGQATHVEVTLRAAGGAWELVLQDDGPGCEPEARRLLGMRERVGPLGGTAEVLCVPGKGTTVRVRMPGGTRGNGTGKTGEKA